MQTSSFSFALISQSLMRCQIGIKLEETAITHKYRADDGRTSLNLLNTGSPIFFFFSLISIFYFMNAKCKKGAHLGRGRRVAGNK